MLIALRNLFNFLTFLVIDFFIGLKKSKVNPKSLLLLRLDSIGDYILFRNFIRLLKEDEKYKEYKITVCGNIIWKDLAETLDTDVVDDFIWMERNNFLNNIKYKLSFLNIIHSIGFETVINSAYTRELLFGDQIVKSSRAKLKIGSIGSPDKNNKTKILSNGFYTTLINQLPGNLFEFNRNKEFFENLLKKKLEINKPVIEVGKVKIFPDLPEEYFLIFPGANHKSRIWDPSNFAQVVNFLLENYKIPVVIAASAKEMHLAEKIKMDIKSDKIIDLSGKTTLSQLIKIISNSKLLITNDTGSVHIAAAVDKPFVCISNGNHFGRFTPYPEDIFNKCKYIYPEEIMNNLHDFNKLIDKYRFSSNLDINEIKPVRVIEEIKEILKN